MTPLDYARFAAVAWVFYRGTLFRWLRSHGPWLWICLAACPLCLGVWAGMIGQSLLVVAPVFVRVVGDCAVIGAITLAWEGWVRGLGPRSHVTAIGILLTRRGRRYWRRRLAAVPLRENQGSRPWEN